MHGMCRVYCLLLAAFVGLARPVEARDWVSQHLVDHPLVGRIWDVAAEAFVEPERVRERLAVATFVLLGEVHSNADHHSLQAELIEHLVAAGRRPAVVMEIFDREDQSAIEHARAADAKRLAAIARATGVEDAGWPWPLYRPIVRLALERDLALVGADLSRAQARAIARDGLGSLDDKRVHALGLDRTLAPAASEAMRAQIVAGHCGHVPAASLDGMMAAQRARDAWLADGLVTQASADGAVLIAGLGHVRTDYGVARYLRARAPRAEVVSVAFMPVRAGKTAPAEYLPGSRDAPKPAFDYLWFTPGSQTGDPCERFEKALRGLDSSE